MNRVIKFRGFSINKKQWVYGDLKRVSSKRAGSWTYIYVDIDDTEEEEKYIQVWPQTVGQFTGRKDRNDVEIFEGDLVLHGERIMKVIYHMTNFTLADINGKNGILLSFSNPIVIGNIHEHGKDQEV